MQTSVLPAMPMSIYQKGPVQRLVYHHQIILISQTSIVIVLKLSIFQLLILFIACSDICATCDGPTPNDCTSCNTGLYLSIINTCENNCPSGTFPDDTSQSCQGNSSLVLLMINYFFIVCDTTCLTCSGPLSANCTSCDTADQTPFLYNSKCYTTCPDGTYPNTPDSKCYRIYRIFPFSEVLMMVLFLACSDSCATCTGPNPNDCTSCHSGLYLSIINTYEDECTSGTFPDTLSQSCQGNSSLLLLMINYFFIACDTTCQTCSGPSNTNCLTCDTAGQTPFFYNSKCYTTCPDGTYPNTADSKCYRI